MATSKASATWTGTIKAGKGVMRPANGPEVPFSMGTRFAGERGSNPEELIGAALAGCYSMALSLGLEQAGITPKSIATSADVRIEQQGEAFRITRIELTTQVTAAGDEGKIRAIAEQTKRGCPVGNALSAVPTELKVKVG